MALKLMNDRYLIIDLQGNYVIYESDNARKLEKKSSSVKEINTKYWELLEEYGSEERQYYDPDASKMFIALEEEHKRYLQNYAAKITTEKYPLMKKHIKDVDKSIPKIVTKGRIGVKGETLEEVYEFVKRYKFFGDTEDC